MIWQKKDRILASGFFALFDDIATLMDDVAAASKVAAQKTAGILGDDLAVGAKKASGFLSSRELPVIWAIAKGATLNKVIILPIAFLLSAFAPKLIIAILLLGGIYLAYEGAEKVCEWFFCPHDERKNADDDKVADPAHVLQKEKKKIRSAIITDFILSIEIIIIALSTVLDQPLEVRIAVVSLIALLAVVAVYGIVALIVRMDDFGLDLIERYPNSKVAQKIGRALIALLPKVIRFLSVVGTLAMLLVAGGIFLHNIEALHHFFEKWPALLGELLLGLAVGTVMLGVVSVVKKIKG